LKVTAYGWIQRNGKILNSRKKADFAPISPFCYVGHGHKKRKNKPQMNPPPLRYGATGNEYTQILDGPDQAASASKG